MATTPVVEQDATISPAQIAWAVAGVITLVAIGIGAALFLLRDPDPVVADVRPTRAPDAQTESPSLDTPTSPALPPDTPQGQLEPPAGQTAPPLDVPPLDVPPQDVPPPDVPPQDLPSPDSPLPADPVPPSSAPEDGEIDLPRLFSLRTLPFGMAEESTTVRQTTRNDLVVTEQTTLLDIDGEDPGSSQPTPSESPSADPSLGTDGPDEDAPQVTVRATRSEDAADRLDATTEGAEELTVRGLPAFLLTDGSLSFLVEGPIDTLIHIEGPDSVGTDALLTLANGLELLR